MKYGIYYSLDKYWSFSDLLTSINEDPKKYKSSVDETFETTDINIAYRYLECLREKQPYNAQYCSVKERD